MYASVNVCIYVFRPPPTLQHNKITGPPALLASYPSSPPFGTSSSHNGQGASSSGRPTSKRLQLLRGACFLCSFPFVLLWCVCMHVCMNGGERRPAVIRCFVAVHAHTHFSTHRNTSTYILRLFLSHTQIHTGSRQQLEQQQQTLMLTSPSPAATVDEVCVSLT